MTRRLTWQKPVLREDEESLREHKTSWLELFYDLIFVAVVAQFSQRFAEHPSLAGALSAGLFFLPVLWSWLGFVFYNDRFETDDLWQRLFTILKMMTLIAIALFLQDTSEEARSGVILSYVALRIVVVLLWVRAGWYNARARPLTNRYALGFSSSILLWLISMAVPPAWQPAFRALGLAIDILTPMTTLTVQAALPKLTSSHFPERFGILVLIVLGDVMVDVIIGRTFGRGPASNLALAFGVYMVIALWWIYFHQIMGEKLKGNMGWRAIWIYAHLPLVLGLLGFGSGHHYLVHHEDLAVDTAARWIFSGSLAMVLASFGLLQWTLPRERKKRTFSVVFCFGGAAVALAAAVFGLDANGSTFLGILVATTLPILATT